MGDEREMRQQVEEYQRLVLSYEALDKEIDTLIMSYNGATENMPKEALQRYRQLARQRDDVENDMRVLEQTLMLSDDTEQ